MGDVMSDEYKYPKKVTPPKKRWLVTLVDDAMRASDEELEELVVEADVLTFSDSHVIFRDGPEYSEPAWVYAIRSDRVWDLEQLAMPEGGWEDEADGS